MRRTTSYGIVALVVLIPLLLLSCQPAQPYTTENSELVARVFVENAPTYAYDGTELELFESNTLRCEHCFIHIYSFISTHEGYGDRTNQAPKQTETPHTISVIIHEDRVIQAIVDNEWNERKQRKIEVYEVLNEGEGSKIPLYYCADPRPNACPSDDEPVCASTRKDFPTPCNACADTMTKWYTKGTCNLGYTERAINDLSRAKISTESATLLILIHNK